MMFSESRPSSGDDLPGVGVGNSVPIGPDPSLAGAPLRSAFPSVSGLGPGGGPTSAENAENRSRRGRNQGRGDWLPPLPTVGDISSLAPPWLFSTALHMVLVIILGLIFIVPERHSLLSLEFDYYDSDDEPLAGGEFDLPMDLQEDQMEESLAPVEIPELSDPCMVSPTAEQSPLVDRSMPLVSNPIQLALSGRERGMQQALLDAYGGTGGTQRAVMESLRWLARNQSRQGIWSLQGPYEDGTVNENEEAATAMALLAFQGAGYTPTESKKSEPFAEAVTRGWRKLLEREDEDGNFYHAGSANGRFYTQGLCTIALCELYGMTHDPQYREPAQRAIDHCVEMQTAEGGWRYFPGSGSDLSVTGWIVMALQSARMAGLEVPTPALEKISGFLDSVSHEYGSRYSYQSTSGPTLSMTAEGLLCRQYLGWNQDDERLVLGVGYLLERLPDWERSDRDVYYWYYATQVCHHMEGRHWQTWNKRMRTVIPEHQVREGKERGSWDPQGFIWQSEGGRMFVTCLSTYMLEVYYRHLPIYQLDLLNGK